MSAEVTQCVTGNTILEFPGYPGFPIVKNNLTLKFVRVELRTKKHFEAYKAVFQITNGQIVVV